MLIIIFQTSAKTSPDIHMLQSILSIELEQQGLLSVGQQVIKSGSAVENEQETLKLEV